MSALFDIIRLKILRDGPISVAHYMELALGHPEHGYYITRDPLGARGDFTTSPEISQVFGELIGIWCASVWQSLGSPSKFLLCEMGPGRGTLMADALRATKKVPGFHEAAQFHMIETSPVLKESQRSALAGQGVTDCQWHRDLSQLPDGPLICIANEFFDALPVRHYQRILTRWLERLVDLNEAKDGLVFRLSNSAAKDHFIPEALRQSPDSSWVETSPVGMRVAHTLADRLKQFGGAGLVIDYGYTETACGETLQALQDHKYADVLAAPGEQDITAHVNFAALSKVAQDAGAKVQGAIPQRDFLNNMGHSLRLGQLARAAKNSEQAEDLVKGASRLTDPDQMGQLFKAMVIHHPDLSPTPGFDETSTL